MRMMHLNWKRSLALVALLVAFNGAESTVAVAQSDKPEAPPAPAPELAPELAPAAPADSAANEEATETPPATRRGRRCLSQALWLGCTACSGKTRQTGSPVRETGSG